MPYISYIYYFAVRALEILGKNGVGLAVGLGKGFGVNDKGVWTDYEFILASVLGELYGVIDVGYRERNLCEAVCSRGVARLSRVSYIDYFAVGADEIFGKRGVGFTVNFREIFGVNNKRVRGN